MFLPVVRHVSLQTGQSLRQSHYFGHYKVERSASGDERNRITYVTPLFKVVEQTYVNIIITGELMNLFIACYIVHALDEKLFCSEKCSCSTRT